MRPPITFPQHPSLLALCFCQPEFARPSSNIFYVYLVEFCIATWNECNKMSRLLRNKEGCWTCRLRRKKCDGTRPECSTCTSLAIPCYGFGPRPDWMDHGEKEKAVATSLKQVVKHSSRRKASTRMPSRLMNIAPKSLKEASSSSSSPGLSIQQDGTHPPENKGSSEDIEDNTAKDKPSTVRTCFT